MTDDSLVLISARQDRLETRIDKQDDRLHAVEGQLAVIPIMTASYNRMTTITGAALIAVIGAAVSVIVFGGPS